MTPSLVWLRQDLRLSDNPALAAAMERRGPVIPLYIWAPEEEGSWPPGAASKWWLGRSLSAIGADLEKRGSRLIVRRGPAAETIAGLVTETGAGAVYWNRRYEPAAIARDQQVKTQLREWGLVAESFNGSVLFEPWTVANQAGKPFRVFTAFWRACMSHAIPAKVADAPKRLPAPESWPSSLAVADLALEPSIDWAAGFREMWQPGEEGAAAQLRRFLGEADAYESSRDRPDAPGTSRLSPHLHFGEISPGQIWRAAPTSRAYLRQLVWREFAYHLLFHFPESTRQPLREDFQAFPWKSDAAAFRAWKSGQTGYPLVDAGMHELWHTGWMHNRVRMVVASFLVKHLLIDWRDGAAWFWDTLVDADLANNTLGWQWVAGCGADAAPYFRIFNPTIQAAKFDPHGEYVRRWAPDSAKLAPIVDHDEARRRALAALASMKRK
ncbi:MAG: deoxyribodipyrimidine photo-lyase [Ignavibacteriota bacterium]